MLKWGVGLFALGCVMGPFAREVVAAPDSAPQDADEESPNPEIAAAKERVQRDTEALVALKSLEAGRLDPSLTAESLFQFGLQDELLIRVIQEWNEPSRARPVGAREILVRAYVRFFRLSPSLRRRIFDTHRRRHEEWKLKQDQSRELDSLVTERQRELETLRKYSNGTLNEDVDLDALLTVKLGGSLLEQLSKFPEETPGNEVPETSGSVEELERVNADLAREKLLLLSLEPGARALLRTTYEANIAPSEPADAVEQADAAAETALSAAAEAARKKAQALEAAEEAKTEALRAFAEEEARLLGVREEQSRFEAELEEQRVRVEKFKELELAWKRRVRELSQRSLLDAEKAADADTAYRALVSELTEPREALAGVLAKLTRATEVAPAPGELRVSLDSVPARADALRSVHTEAASVAEALRQAAVDARWEQAEDLRDTVVGLNRTRLALLEHVSPELGFALQSYGFEGVQQVKRELRQIRLEVQFHLLNFPRHVTKHLHQLAVSPVPLLISLLKLIALVVLFRWWRASAEHLLENAEKSMASQRPRTFVSDGLAVLVWYLRQVRGPLEVLVFLFVLLGALSSLGASTERAYLWNIALWILLGNFVVRLLHAIASRQTTKDESASLRLRSLKMVGVTVVSLGLILSLTRLSVGAGAIYSWVLSSCWLLGLPVAVRLIAWWRPTIFRRARQVQSPGAPIAWVLRHEKGPVSYLAAAFGGIKLLLDGVYRFALRKASTLAVTQSVLAYLFRREVEKRAEAELAVKDYQDLEPELFERLGPHQPSSVRVDSVEEGSIRRIVDVVSEEKMALVAVVGERGQGKTTFLDRVESELPQGEVLRITCGPKGFASILSALTHALGLAAGTQPGEVMTALNERGYAAIFLDNGQRMVRPLIGGLRDIDKLTAFAREMAGQTAWLIALEKPSYRYLRRARGERALFDDVVELAAWTDEQIAQLTQLRAAELDLQVGYQDLVVPQRAGAALRDVELSNTERDYCRILWDYASGNPTVALHFFRCSLARRRGDIRVRLFKPPPLSELEELPSSAYFVLRTIIQLESARERDIVECTHLAPADVADALRLARHKKFIEEHDARIRVSLPWYRAITTVLVRQHLLSA